MSRSVEKPTTMPALLKLVRDECHQRWRERFNEEWSYRDISPSVEARGTAAELAKILRKAVEVLNKAQEFCAGLAPDLPPSSPEKVLASLVERLTTCFGEIYPASDRDRPLIDELEVVADKSMATPPERSRLVQEAFLWAAARNETIDDLEIAVASILLGNFPSGKAFANRVKEGQMSVSEAIDAEYDNIRQARFREEQARAVELSTALGVPTPSDSETRAKSQKARTPGAKSGLSYPPHFKVPSTTAPGPEDDVKGAKKKR